MQQQPQMAMVCLQAQQVAGLPDAAEARRIQLSTACTPAPAAAVAVCRAGVADFHHQVLHLHCAPINSIDAVALTVTMAACSDPAAAPSPIIASVTLDLAEQLRRPCPSPSALSFVLGVGVGGDTTAATPAAAGAVLSLTLHHKLLVTTTGIGTAGCSSLLRGCLTGFCRAPVLRTTTKQNRQHHQHHHQGPAEAADHDYDGDSSSSGFITIEKGTISRRRPPSDCLLTTTDDDEVDGKRPTTTTCYWSLDDDDDIKVENDFLAMLMVEDDEEDGLDLDALIKDAEGEADLRVRQMAKPRG